MEDWRLNGQEEYLKDAVLYKITFPEFWKKAYTEKNEFYQLILADAHRFVQTAKRGEEYLDFCWRKATTDEASDFYCTKDLRYWICQECFDAFREPFGWTVKSADEL